MYKEKRPILEDTIYLCLEKGFTVKNGRFTMDKQEEKTEPIKKQPLVHIIAYCSAIMIALVILAKAIFS